MIKSENVRCSLDMKPRFRAVWEMLSEELTCKLFFSPKSGNSILEELRVKKLAMIQEEIC